MLKYFKNMLNYAKIYQNRLSDRICKFTETCLIDNLIKLYVKSKKYYENFYVTPEKTYDKINAKKWLFTNKWKDRQL